MNAARKPIRVLIVDDSASAREALRSVIAAEPDMEVIAAAGDPFAAAKAIQNETPDVILLDIEMPRMDGLTFLRKIMSQRPIPCVLCSTLLEQGSETALAALEAGAVDIIQKPKLGTAQFLTDARVRVGEAVRAAAKARLRPRSAAVDTPKKLNADAIMPSPGRSRPLKVTTDKVVCIGASTGGTESLREVLTALPVNCPGLVIVQHMPERFTAAFARRLDSLCAIDVKEAEDGDAVLEGRALIAPGNRHLLLRRNGARYHVEINDGPPVARHRPSVDVLFRSAAVCAGANALGVLMTGMGDDGARGLLEMRRADALTLAQNEESCVVFGMPKEAIALGAVERILHLRDIAAAILSVRALA